MEFTTELQATGGNTTGFQLTPETVEGLGAGKRPKVVVTVNGHTWRSSIAPMRGEYWLGVSAANRAAAGIAGGDAVVVELEVDSSPRTVEVPADLTEALDSDPAAKAAWDRLSYSHQREHATAIESAKAAQTRQRRVDKAMAMLRGS